MPKPLVGVLLAILVVVALVRCWPRDEPPVTVPTAVAPDVR